MSGIYNPIREQLISWAINADAPAGLDFYVIGVDASYTFSASHNDLTDVGAGPVVATEHLLDNVTYVNGVLDADDETWTDLVPTEVMDAAIIYLKDGASATYLVCYIDQSPDGSVPQTIDSSTGTMRWSDSGICKL